jgi:hypothetical protein
MADIGNYQVALRLFSHHMVIKLPNLPGRGRRIELARSQGILDPWTKPKSSE